MTRLLFPGRSRAREGRRAIGETLRVAKGTKHPVAARVLINWMISPDFISAGWTQDPATGTETNTWKLSKQDFLQTYFGGINADGRKLAPKWASLLSAGSPAVTSASRSSPRTDEAISNKYKALP